MLVRTPLNSGHILITNAKKSGVLNDRRMVDAEEHEPIVVSDNYSCIYIHSNSIIVEIQQQQKLTLPILSNLCT